MISVIRLCHGIGEEGVSHCVMAATSIVAGEKFSDRPSCVCPTIRSALINLNDSYGDDNESREAALGHLPWLIIGTRGDVDVANRRAFMFADFAVRQICGIACRPIVDCDTAVAAHAAADAADATAARAAARAARAAHAAADAAAVVAARAARAAVVAADAADAADWREKLVAFIESDIIPVHTTMVVEPGHRIEELITR